MPPDRRLDLTEWSAGNPGQMKIEVRVVSVHEAGVWSVLKVQAPIIPPPQSAATVRVQPAGRKNMHLKMLSLLLCGIGSVSFCQGHYPLHVGNQWDYGEIDFHTPGQYQYLYSVRIVGDTTMPNGENYAIQQGDFGTKYLRQSGSRVYSFVSDKDYVLYDFSLQQGDTASFVQDGSYFTLVTVYVGQGEVFGKSVTRWTYVTTTNTSSDGGSVLTIADSIGRTYLFLDGGYTDYLMGAIINGTRYGTVTQIARRTDVHPAEFRLFQNFPNPFNPTTTVEYFVPATSEVSIYLFSALGEKVSLVFQGVQNPGLHIAHINGTNLASGVYFVQLVAPGVSISKSVLLIK